jgi:hypothetical protein
VRWPRRAQRDVAPEVALRADTDILDDPLAEAERLRELRKSTVQDLRAAAQRLRIVNGREGRHA